MAGKGSLRQFFEASYVFEHNMIKMTKFACVHSQTIWYKYLWSTDQPNRCYTPNSTQGNAIRISHTRLYYTIFPKIKINNTRRVSNLCALLTAEHHGEDGEDLLGVGVGRHVAEADAGEAGEGEVEGGDVLGADVGAARRVVLHVRHGERVGEVVEPADRRAQLLTLRVRNRVEDAGEPVSDEREAGHEEEEDGRAVLRVLVDTTRDAHEPQQAGRLQHPVNGHRLRERGSWREGEGDREEEGEREGEGEGKREG